MRSPILFATALLSSGCVTIPNTTACSVAGTMSGGMVCAQSNKPVTSELTLDQAIEFLEPQTEPSPRAGAICMSAADYGRQKTALEQACRMLGGKCQFEGKK